MTSCFQEKYNCKNLKKTFLQLKCSKVLLHLEYKLFLCKPKIELKNLPGAKALATDHRVSILATIIYVAGHCLYVAAAVFYMHNYIIRYSHAYTF